MPFPLYILLRVLPAFPRAYLIIYADFFDSQEPGQEKIDVRAHILRFWGFRRMGVWHLENALKMHEKC